MRFPQDYLYVLSKRRGLAWSIFLTVIAVTIGLILFLPKRYEATATLLLDSQAGFGGGGMLSDLVGGPSGPSPETELEAVTARPNLEKVIAKMQLDTRPEDLEKQVRVMHPKQTNLLKLTGDGETPRQAADIVNNLIAVYTKSLQERNEGEAEDTAGDVKRRIKEVEADLGKKEREITAWLQAHNVGAPEEEVKALVETLGMVQQDYEKAKAARAGVRAQAAKAKELLDRVAPTVRQSESLGASLVIETMQGKLYDLYAQRSAAAYEYKEDQPEVKALDSQIAEMKRNLAAEMSKTVGGLVVKDRTDAMNPVLATAVQRYADNQVEIRAADAQVDALGDSLSRYRAQIDALPAKSQELGKLRREQEALAAVWGGLVQKYEQLKVQSYATSVHTQVIEPATPPIRMARPRPFLYSVVGLLLAVVLSITACLAVENVDRRLMTTRDVEMLGVESFGRYPASLPACDADRLWARLVLSGAGSDWHVLAIVPTAAETGTARALAEAAERQGQRTAVMRSEEFTEAAAYGRFSEGSALVVLELPPLTESPSACNAVRLADRALLDISQGADRDVVAEGPLSALQGARVPLIGAAIFEGREVRG